MNKKFLSPILAILLAFGAMSAANAGLILSEDDDPDVVVMDPSAGWTDPDPFGLILSE